MATTKAKKPKARKTTGKRDASKNRGQMLNRASLELARLASKADDQPSLCVLRITDEETIATNGTFLGRVTHPVVDRHAVRPNAPVALSDRALPPCSIPREVALDISKLIPRGTEENPHHFAFIDLEQKRGKKLQIVVKQADATQHIEIGEVQLEFPNTRAVMPAKGSAAQSFAMNHKLLSVVLATARRMGLDSEMQFYVPDAPDKPILIEGRIADTEQDAAFVIMPMRSDRIEKGKPETAETELIPRKCIYCGCTDERPCNPPCTWVRPKDTGGREVCDAKKCLDKLGRDIAKSSAGK